VFYFLLEIPSTDRRIQSRKPAAAEQSSWFLPTHSCGYANTLSYHTSSGTAWHNG